MEQELKNRIRNKKCLTAMEIRSNKDINYAENSDVDLIVLQYATYLGISKVGAMLPLGNPNETILSFIKEMQPIETKIPIIAGICGTEPCRNLALYLQQLKMYGIGGVQNSPSVGLIDGVYRQNLEAVKLGYERECALMEKCLDAGMISLPLVFKQEEAEAMIKVGCRILIYHMGLRLFSTRRKIGSDEFNDYWSFLEDTAKEIKDKHPDVMILAYTEKNMFYEQMMARVDSETSLVDGVYQNLSL